MFDRGDAASAWRIMAELSVSDPEISDIWYDIFLERLDEESGNGTNKSMGDGR